MNHKNYYFNLKISLVLSFFLFNCALLSGQQFTSVEDCPQATSSNTCPEVVTASIIDIETSAGNQCLVTVAVMYQKNSANNSSLAWVLKDNLGNTLTPDACKVEEIGKNNGAPDMGTIEFTATMTTSCDATLTFKWAGYTNPTCGGNCCGGGVVVGDVVEGVLPIELLYFRGEATGSNNTIEWATATEENNEIQIVQRSPNGEDQFEDIGFVIPAGWSAETQTYSLVDDQPLPLGYYRLKSVDYDGFTQYSEVVIIERAQGRFGAMKVFPNPTHSAVTMYYEIDRPTKVRLTVVDVFGKTVFDESFEAEEGIGRREIDLEQQADGVYFMTIDNGQYVSTERILKVTNE